MEDVLSMKRDQNRNGKKKKKGLEKLSRKENDIA